MIQSLFGSQPILPLCAFIADFPLTKEWSVPALPQISLKFPSSALLKVVQPSTKFSLQDDTFQLNLLPQEEAPGAVSSPVSQHWEAV